MKNRASNIVGRIRNKNKIDIKPEKLAKDLKSLKQNWNVAQSFFHLLRLSWIRLFGLATQKEGIVTQISILRSIMILFSTFLLILVASSITIFGNEYQFLWDDIYILIIDVFPFWQDIAQILNDLRLIWQDIFTDTDLDTQLNFIGNMIYYIGRHSSNFFIHLL